MPNHSLKKPWNVSMAAKGNSKNVPLDSASSFPKIHLSFALNRFAPCRHLRAINDPDIRKSIEDSILQQFPNNEHIYHVFTGGTMAGIMWPHFYDYNKDVAVPLDFSELQEQVTAIALRDDKWISTTQKKLALTKPDLSWIIVTANKLVGLQEMEHGKRVQFTMDLNGCFPGYTRLKVVNPSTTDNIFKVKSGISDYHLSSKAILADFQQELAKKKQHLKNILSKSTESAAEDTSNVDQYLEESNSIDVLIALPCSSWPGAAEKWPIRERKSDWPGRELIDKIVKCGVFIIPQSHGESKQPDVEWEICFAAAETELAKTLNDVQCQILALLKFITFHNFNSSTFKYLTFYHMKHVAFWMFEEVPLSQWNSENLGKCFQAVLNKATKFYEDGNLPDYFIPEHNLIKPKLKPSDRKLIVSVLKEIKENPVKFLVTFTEKYQLIYLPYMLEMSEVLQPLSVQRMSGKQCAMTDAPTFVENQQQLDVLEKLALQYFKECSYKEAVEVYKEYTVLFNKDKTTEADNFFHPEYKVMSMASTLDNLSVRIIYGILLENFPYSQYRLEILGNLAEKYEKAYFLTEDPHKRSMYREKTEEYYTCAITMPLCLPNVKIGYTRFLYAIKAYDSAIEILEDLVDAEALSCETAVAYNKTDLSRLDATLKKVVTKYSTFIVPPAILGHYILTSSYKHSGRKEQAQISLLKFKIACKDLAEMDIWKSDLVNKCMYGLLGQTAEDLGHYDIAGDAFSKSE